jgi:hypothetical protein
LTSLEPKFIPFLNPGGTVFRSRINNTMSLKLQLKPIWTF